MNCLRRGSYCGSKIPGPKRQEPYSIDGTRLQEYDRLFERFQQIRPADSPYEIEKLVELAEIGTLKEQGNTFVVCVSEEPEIKPEGSIPRGQRSSHRLGTCRGRYYPNNRAA
jgi:hypothetical protein